MMFRSSEGIGMLIRLLLGLAWTCARHDTHTMDLWPDLRPRDQGCC